MKILNRFTNETIYEGEAQTLKELVGLAIKSGADLFGADLSGADLSGADLSGADLSRADLSGADLSGADLSRADLSRANLSGADLYGVDLYGADLYGADLYGADLSGADLSGADLSGADLYGAKSIHDVMTMGRIGSRGAYLTALLTDDGIICKTGCFSGTLKEFKKAVKETHGRNKHAQAYGLAIKLIELRFNPQLKKLRDTQ